MTENERFYTKESILTDVSVILDKEQKYTFPTLEYTMNFMFKKALNELNDECDFLKIENESLEDGAQKYVELYHKSLKENEQLKEQLKDCQQKKQNVKDLLANSEPVVEQKKIQELIYQVVINLIDEKIEELEGWYKFGQEVYHGCPMHNIRFGINTLKELKKELKEDDRD